MVRISAVAAMMLSLALATPSRAEPTKIIIGHPVASDFLATYVAKEKGFFEKHNIDATLTKIPIITVVPQALVSNSLQIGATTLGTALQAIDAGLDLKLIAGAGRMVKGSPFISLMARKDVTIEKPADLEGKKVGVPGAGSFMEQFLREWMLQAKADAKKTTFVEAPLPQLPDMLKAGTVDAVLIVEPLRSMIINTGVGKVGAEYINEVDPSVLVSAYLVTGDWAAKNAETIRNFRAALDDGLAYINSGAPDLKEIEKKTIGFNSPRLASFDNKVTADDLKTFIMIGKDLNIYRTTFDTDKIILK
jgi:NitT/TauT family transport system substrate-binding protein